MIPVTTFRFTQEESDVIARDVTLQMDLVSIATKRQWSASPDMIDHLNEKAGKVARRFNTTNLMSQEKGGTYPGTYERIVLFDLIDVCRLLLSELTNQSRPEFWQELLNLPELDASGFATMRRRSAERVQWLIERLSAATLTNEVVSNYEP